MNHPSNHAPTSRKPKHLFQVTIHPWLCHLLSSPPRRRRERRAGPGEGADRHRGARRHGRCEERGGYRADEGWTVAHLHRHSVSRWTGTG